MKRRAYVAAIFAGIAAVAVLVVLLLGPGRFDPSPPSLQRDPVPEIPGEILYIDRDDCIVRAKASGLDREQVRCVGPDVNNVSWLTDTTIGYATFGPGRPVWNEVDLSTGKTTVTNRFPQPEPPNPVSVKGERIDFDREGSVYRVTDGERTKIFDFDGPEYQRPWLVTWSPDGEWLLLRYREELWIVSRDGSVQGTLARTRDHPQNASWRIEGHGYLPRITLRDADATPAVPGIR